MSRPLFPLGQVVATPGVLSGVLPHVASHALHRHASGDWGDIHPDDLGLNDAALRNGDRLLSVYPITDGSEEKFWIITEADRSVTTLLLPSEY